ncbi:VWA domain-containing protein, partial [Teichococcus cervicalis]
MQPVDLALCLAVDVSASVDYDEFGLMVGGLANAFRQEDIAAACSAGPRGAVAVAVLFWSSAQEVAVPWMRLDGADSAAALAEAIDNAPRLPAPGATALGPGMAAGLAL